MPSGRVVLVGATGFTGRLVARRLAAADLHFEVTGRGRERLAELASEVGEPPTHVIDLETSGGRLRELLRAGDVVVNCAGPFSRLGEPVVRACIAAGAHYLDISGEQRFMKRVMDGFDRPARQADVAIANAMGFDYAIGDCLAAIAAERAHGRLLTVDVFYSWPDGPARTSHGTRLSILGVLQDGGFSFEHGRLRERLTGSLNCTVDIPGGSRRTGIWFPGGEILTVPRHVVVERVSCWMVVDRPTGILLPRVAWALPTVTRLGGGAAERLIRRSPDGPTAAERQRSSFLVVVRARTPSGKRISALAHGRDAYGSTAALVTEAARRILAGEVSERGVLAPSQLIEPRLLLDSLGSESLRWGFETPDPALSGEPS